MTTKKKPKARKSVKKRKPARARKSAPKKRVYKKRGGVVINQSSAELYKPAQHPSMGQQKLSEKTDDIENSLKDIMNSDFEVDRIEIQRDYICVVMEDNIGNIETHLTEKLWGLGLVIWCKKREKMWLKHTEKMEAYE